MTACAWVYTADAPPPSIGAAPMIATMLGRLGMEGVHCREISVHNAGMIVASTSVFVQSACGRVGILCYRGTEPQNAMNWMTDLDINPTGMSPVISKGDRQALVHNGFQRNLDATWLLVNQVIDRALAGKPVDSKSHGDLQPLEALFVTGHSLGAAMAALAGVQFALDPSHRKVVRPKIRGIYTYGQPMVGNPDYAAVCSKDPLLREGLFRHVYANDVVPHCPPIESGLFVHFGREFRASDGTGWREHEEYSLQAPDFLMSTVVIPQLMYWGKQLAATRGLAQHGYSWYEHMPPSYLRACEISRVTSGV
jgi:hypothetical protein